MHISTTYRIRKYDTEFRKWTELYMPTVDWRLLKAQCNTESNLNPRAESGVGAEGLCQFMLGTWHEQEKELRIKGTPFDPSLNIQFAAYYMGKLRRVWRAERPEWDRHSLAMASYNAGSGNLLRAQRLCGEPNLYESIVPCLPRVTGVANSKQTTDYVRRNWATFSAIIVWDGDQVPAYLSRTEQESP